MTALHELGAEEAPSRFRRRELSPGELYPELGRILDAHRALICPTMAVLPRARGPVQHVRQLPGHGGAVGPTR